MKPTVAVEESLGNVAAVLAANGLAVRRIRDLGAAAQELADCQAVVVSGLDSNLAGYADIVEDIPVIEARGQDAEAVLAAVRQRLGLAAE